ncbi:MBL fold metallo-hydrolase [Salicibibacter cibi]|uniref:MBL fold metallo-hydrolase n=1 Tax=Salicibibacter cibi TaxID=2743001 RepID=A0A7T6ZBK1_9BACI|nr:alkyl sulfatase dimerization domain-containing protein [Salicibibacter cibi]QQK80498.1 MBL fold metallo-hydrolase [Salicibibacter cibi]
MVKKKNRYMSEPAEKVTMSNGAIVNKQMGEYYSQVSKPKVTHLTDKIAVLEHFSIDNTVVIQGDNGLIIWDTGFNMGVGKQKFEAIRNFTDKPVKAVIYSHNHYTNGARQFVPKGFEGIDIEVIAHPDVHKNVLNSSVELGKMLKKTTAQHFGFYLPKVGPDAPPVSYDGGVEADKSSGYVQPTYGVQDKEEMEIDGVRFQFFHTPSDTMDSITAWLPEHDTVITNSIWHVLPNLYTLRGQPYRDPLYWLEGIDQVRKLNPKILIPAHGEPVSTKESSYELATNYRDAIAFIYSQTIRGINKGLKSDEIAEEVTLPEHLANHPRLKEVYGELTHQVKGIYSGLIGWFSLDAADINPMSTQYRSEKIVEGFGGIEKVIQASEKALKEREYAWTAELITHVLNIHPDKEQARLIKAKALREMGQATPALSSRGFYLSQALHLEGKIDLNNISNPFLPIEKSIKLLEYKIDPEKLGQINKLLKICFSDLTECFGLDVRKGVAEFLEEEPIDPDITLKISSNLWISFVLGKLEIEEVMEDSNVQVDGNQSVLIEVMQAFEL